jgi:hypothetical protein
VPQAHTQAQPMQAPTQPVQINVVTGNNNKLTESPAIETTPMIKRPVASNESNGSANNNVSFSEMMMSSSSSDDANKIDSIPTGSKSGPIIVRKV